MFKKLQGKFLFLNMAVTSLVMLTAFVIVFLTTYTSTKMEIERKLGNVSGSLVMNESIDSEALEGEFSNIENENDMVISSHRVTSDYTLSFIITVDKEGNILNVDSPVDISEEQYTQAAHTAWDGQDKSRMTINERSLAYRVSPVQITHSVNGELVETESTDFYQISFLDITDMQKNLNNLLLTFLFVGTGMLAVIFVISIFFAKRAIRPISESWEKQKRFIADASHELKTPLTTIMANCDVLEANEDETVKSQREWLGYIKIGTDRIAKLTNSLLTLARVEGMNIQTVKESFDMSALVCEVMQSMDAAAAARNLRIDGKIEFTGDTFGHEDSVRQIFTILYENAIKYADEGGSINVSVRRTKKGVSCTVRNTGKGIPAKDLHYVFDRFYRSDTARNSDENSYGLGLSIAKGIAEQIGGKITVKSTENDWTSFTFTFEI